MKFQACFYFILICSIGSSSLASSKMICIQESSILHSKLNKVRAVTFDDQLWILSGDSKFTKAQQFPLKIQKGCYFIKEKHSRKIVHKNSKIESMYYSLTSKGVELLIEKREIKKI